MQGLKLSLFLAVLFIATGCASVPPVDFTVQDVGLVDSRQDANLRSLTVGYAPQDQQKTVEGDASIPPLWKESLQDAVNRSLVFTDNAETNINLSVRITHFDIPAGGFDMRSEVAAIYEIMDRSNGDILFTQEIMTEGVVPMDYALSGSVRSVESWNRAVRNNIAEFINVMSETDLSKPVFGS